mmetsp:Transcript_31042/g.81196  ORF Transcript_31042/g.81196 Transcript_31042/m.81196 type:complete len:89 (-) Transcript_31042:307-573(-)
MQGVDVTESETGALFDDWDTDGSGTISYVELKKILTKRLKAPKAAAVPPRRGRERTQTEPRMCYASPPADEAKTDDRRGGKSLSTSQI